MDAHATGGTTSEQGGIRPPVHEQRRHQVHGDVDAQRAGVRVWQDADCMAGAGLAGVLQRGTKNQAGRALVTVRQRVKRGGGIARAAACAGLHGLPLLAGHRAQLLVT